MSSSVLITYYTGSSLHRNHWKYAKLVYILFTLLLATSLQLAYCEERLKTKTICRPTSCLDLLCLGHNETGVYTIYPTGHADSSIDVFCDQETDGGGWTVMLQRSLYGWVDFFKRWDDYKLGFGYLSEEFCLGNDSLAADLQANTNSELTFNLYSTTNKQDYAKCSSFNVEVMNCH
ncbi:hypothetical protein EB796_023701 [Bugula neritina]|uniref:Fibrinogen C-terminal domain-containing protein n=1 Tax=Bugula neritina TaxID=10212 RepID=A0A7J7IW06_BUGNE|nr:hypothetical protein EB796_023701 [Bugula neritina]